jgi:hypothetical protein
MNTARITLVVAAAILATLALPVVSADIAPAAKPLATDANAPVRKPAAEMVRMVSFRLKDGRTVSGRVMNDDRTQVTVSEPSAGVLVSGSYSRLDMEPRSINYQTVSEYQYWLNTGQYFEARTWDFKDDADEFAQALRCYQTAGDIAAAAMGKDSTAAQEAQARIRKLLDSRQRWIEDVTPRARMAELEFKSTLATRLQELSQSISALQTGVDQLKLSATANEQKLADYQRTVDEKLSRMADDIRRNYEYIRDNMYRTNTIITPSTGPMPR